MEFILVDDDPGVEAELQVPPGMRSRTRTTRTSGVGAGGARNAGAELSQGELLLFADDDAVPGPTWVSQMAAAHRRSPGAALAGRVVALDDGGYARATELIDRAVRRAHLDQEGAEFLAASNAGFPAERFRELGGFNDSLPVSEDRELRDRWLERGWPIVFVPDAAVEHEHPARLRDFWRVQFGYGRGAYQHHRRRAAGERAAPGIRTTARTLRHAASAGRSDPGALARIALWQIANATGAAREALGDLRRSRVSAR